MVSACEDGHGGEDFYRILKDSTNLQDTMNTILARKRNETVFDQWESQILLRILLKHDVIMVTKAPQQMIEDMHMHYTDNIEDAMAMADAILAKRGITDGSVTVIPDGVSVIVK